MFASCTIEGVSNALIIGRIGDLVGRKYAFLVTLVIMGGSGPGVVTDKELRNIAEKWGTLPPEKRAKIIEDINRDLPAKYKPMIDEYFKALNRLHGFK